MTALFIEQFSFVILMSSIQGNTMFLARLCTKYSKYIILLFPEASGLFVSMSVN